MSVRSVSTESFGLRAQFIEIAQHLRDRLPSLHADKPLAYWAVASDRRLPYALLDRPLREIVTASFDDLAATPGIGHRKITSLVMLLRRASEEEPPEVEADTSAQVPDVLSNNHFDPACVSELQWAQWRETVRQCEFRKEPLGRFVSSLQSLPTVVWDKPLGDYLDLTVDQVRGLPAHGDKRVSAVLEVFCSVHRVLGQSQIGSRLAVHLRPVFVPAIERWICSLLERHEVPSLQELRQHVVLPSLNQIELDAGETVHRLAAGRLGIESLPEAVRDQARELGVTRARIYQLLETCYAVMKVRWPEGRWLLRLLNDFAKERSRDEEMIALIDALQRLLYPLRLRQRVSEPAIA